MGVYGLLNWIKEKYPRTIRKTLPTFESYDMLFIDMPQYIMAGYHLIEKPYSNSCMVISKILSDIDRLIQFTKPNELIFFSFECINGFMPYAKTITKRFRKMEIKLSDEVFTEEDEDNFELLNLDDLNDDELIDELKKYLKHEDIKDSQKIQKIVDKINQDKIFNAKKEKKEKTMSNEKIEDIELDENEFPTLLTIDNIMQTVKKADYDKERVPSMRDFQIEFQKEFHFFYKKKMELDPLYQNKKVIICDNLVQGEAEHKIMTFLRDESLQPDWNPNKKICICSKDNDLITLSLQSHIQNITILNRINQNLTAKLIDIKVLRDSIGLELNVTNQELAKKIDDFVLITLLISNDYTPKIPDLPDCSIDVLFNLYKSIIKENPNFALFMSDNKSGECSFNVESVKFFLNKLIKEFIVPEPEIAETILTKFKEVFPDPPIEEMSKSFFETIAWTMYLYKCGNPSYSHYYKYQYSPPLCVAIKYVDSIKKSIKSFKNNFSFLSKNVLYVFNAGKSSGTIDQELLNKIKAPESPISYMFEDSFKKIDIELIIKTVEKYEKELGLQQYTNKFAQSKCYFYQKDANGQSRFLKPTSVFLNRNTNKRPFRYPIKGIKNGIFTPEFWPIKEDMTFEQAQRMKNKMVFFNRPYKIPATINSVLKYDDISEEERQEAFNQISLENPLKLEHNDDSNEGSSQNDTTDKTKEEENVENEKIKEKLIFFKVTPLSQYQCKEKNIKDVIIYAPYAFPVANTKLLMNNIIKLKPRQYVITENGYYGIVNSINIAKKTATVDCFIPSPNIDNSIREIVKNDSENYITQEEFANQVGITLESVPLIASNLILMPDKSNISIKFYSQKYSKMMCGFCIKDENDNFLFSKEAVSIAKKYLNQPKIFKLLIEQSASQTEIRKANNEKENENKNEEPEIKTEEVIHESEEQPNKNNDDNNNDNDNNSNNNSNENDNNNEEKSNDANVDQLDEIEYEYEEEINEEKRKKKYNKTTTERMKYLNEPEPENEEEFVDSFDIQLPSNEETENDPPSSIKLPIQVRSTIITRLDTFFKHHKSVYASIFYRLGSSSLSIESIHKVDQILSQKTEQTKTKGKSTEKKTMTLPIDQISSLGEYVIMENTTFKAGDRIVVQNNRGLGIFGKYGTIICANNDDQKAVICLDVPFYPCKSIIFTNYRMKNNFSSDCVIELPYSVLKLINNIE